MNLDRISLQNFFYVEKLDQLIPFYNGKNTELALNVHLQDKIVELVLRSNHSGDILPIRTEFDIAALKGDQIVIRTIERLVSYLESQGVISVKIMPFYIE
ncbi:hypothetical protein XaC1_171 [Xanthomonas phage XaC1]|nr:hypothetical protein XaC1_171 [Xanthomonas phage XaC1]